MSQPEPSDWGNSYGNIYGCASIQSTTQAGQSTSTSRKPITIHTTQTFQPGNTTSAPTSASTAGQTATTSSLTRPTGPGPDPGYTPCQEYVVVAADVTRLLTADNFKVGYRTEFYQLHIFFHEPS
ncbi:hypothetical protein FO519_010242 [Halicephalobus sp. NKZ332]|nr:hypothetical protein FO519_010242 [Halicephalobus sp. NKZ332]